jgi:hypothetical protein
MMMNRRVLLLPVGTTTSVAMASQLVTSGVTLLPSTGHFSVVGSLNLDVSYYYRLHY